MFPPRRKRGMVGSGSPRSTWAHPLSWSFGLWMLPRGRWVHRIRACWMRRTLRVGMLVTPMTCRNLIGQYRQLSEFWRLSGIHQYMARVCDAQCRNLSDMSTSSPSTSLPFWTRTGRGNDHLLYSSALNLIRPYFRSRDSCASILPAAPKGTTRLKLVQGQLDRHDVLWS